MVKFVLEPIGPLSLSLSKWLKRLELATTPPWIRSYSIARFPLSILSGFPDNLLVPFKIQVHGYDLPWISQIFQPYFKQHLKYCTFNYQASGSSHILITHSPLIPYDKLTNALTPMSDQHKISPYNINIIFCKQVMRIKGKIVIKRILSWSRKKFFKLTSENCLADSMENYSQDHGSERFN